MLPRERVLAALEHREPDRIPWGEHWIDYNVYEDILGRPTFVHGKMKETRALWEGRRGEVVASYKRDILDLVRALDMDIVATYEMPAGNEQPMEQVAEDVYRDRDGSIYHVSATTHDLMPYKLNTANYRPPTLTSLQEEIDRIDQEPLGDPADPRWELVRHAVAEMKGTHFVIVLTADMAHPSFGATEEERWMNMVTEPQICNKIAERNGKRLVRQVQLYARLGVDGIMPCGDLGNSTGMMASPAIWRERVYPWNKAVVAEAHRLGLKVLKHCCGHTWPVVDQLAEIYDAYEGIQASAGMDLRKLKERVGRETCLWGGIWHEHIILGNVEDIRDDARYSFEYAAPGGGYIMGSTHSLAVDAPRENILAMKRCRDEWGVYPIEPRRWR